MKKTLLSAAALLCTFAALAQTPTAVAQDGRAPKQAKHDGKTKQHNEDKDDADVQKAAPVNHGQAVSAVATTTTLTGAAKGAAVSTVARSDAKAAKGIRPERSARGDRSHGNRQTGSTHAAGHDKSGAGHGKR
ncbi:hypothetical protein SAMN06265337_2244 [Hymenobacter gelipurpurascens]|uniref:Uncharacterized protein n=1 Tax=Hymenobacter gelipurpurascens TaxID=89968 RepID=A0A212TQJ7_9BACT|nr:hypothetical protein [Hymenobacter gelipurpurascens]SNC68297.1 hypothetical protein SAMN06265337_2244 [Hymenobacter gelipurpurascens]